MALRPSYLLSDYSGRELAFATLVGENLVK